MMRTSRSMALQSRAARPKNYSLAPVLRGEGWGEGWLGTCRSCCSALLLLALLALTAGRASADTTADQGLQQAAAAFKDHQPDQALKILHDLAGDPQLVREDRLRALQRLVEYSRQSKKYESGIAATAAMTATAQGDDAYLQQVYFARADLCWMAGRQAEALEALHQVVAHARRDKENAILARQRATSYLQSTKDLARLYEEATQWLHLLDDDPRAPDALWLMVETSWRSERYAQCLQDARRLLADFPQAGVWQSRAVHQRIVECLRKLDKPAEVRTLYEQWAKDDPDAYFRQRWSLEAARCYAAEKDAPGALAAYRRVITGHCGENISEFWYESQSRIVDLLAESGDLTAALREARVSLDASRPASIAGEIRRISDLFNRLDKDRTRGDQFAAYQFYGPAGEDGQSGTDDDLSDPLAELGYPPGADRQEAFSKVFAQLGPTAAASYQRAMMCLYAGQPRPAFCWFRDALRRGESGKFGEYATALVFNGLRAVRGHAAGLAPAAEYVLYGPAGKDGQPQTDDDLPDPFAPYAKLAPAAPWSVAALSADETRLLKSLRVSLQAAVVDESWAVEVRQKALVSLARVNETLDAWPQDAAWYHERLLNDAPAKFRPHLLAGLLAAAKGEALHFGHVRATLASLEALPDVDKSLARTFTEGATAFRRGLRDLESSRLQKPALPVKSKSRR
jgi:tetratricopeptide (TPR) repeat protein